VSKTQEALNRIRDLPDQELTESLVRAREELFRLKLGNYTNQVENALQLRFKRREVARILTIMRSRALGKETQSQGKAARAEAKAEPVQAAAKEKPAKAARATTKEKAAPPKKTAAKKKKED
jgi:large subunit ribosomal protein L29